MTNSNAIEFVIKKELCTGCGTCVSLCPTNAIELKINAKKAVYMPTINEDKCTKCGICFNVCAGYDFDPKILDTSILEKKQKHILIGNYLNCYIGHSNETDIRYNSASGGLITQILIFALEEGIIDGALVTKMKKDNPLEPEPFIARTKEEIIESSKSIYCPVPANLALQEILNSRDGDKFAVVGLPCHIQGVRKAEQINKKLDEKIVLHLGLFCNHVPNFWATILFLRRLKINTKDIVKITYRGEGYPGKMTITMKTGERSIPLPKYWNFVGSMFFYPTRCLMCSDGICESSDIAFGDAWLPEFSNEKIGKSIFVSQTKVGEDIVHRMNLKNIIESSTISVDKVIESQAGMLHFKKKNLSARIPLFDVVPKHNNLLKADYFDYAFSSYFYANSHVSSNSFLRGILCHIPSSILWLHTVSYSIIYSKKIKRDFNKIKWNQENS
jgi:coenzyme F420 hydrogenase subunit beta